MAANSLLGIFFQNSGFISDRGTGVDLLRVTGVSGVPDASQPAEGVETGNPERRPIGGGGGGGGRGGASAGAPSRRTTGRPSGVPKFGGSGGGGGGGIT